MTQWRETPEAFSFCPARFLEGFLLPCWLNGDDTVENSKEPEDSAVQHGNHQTYSIPEQLRSNTVQFSHSVMSNSLWPHGLQHSRLSCPSPTPGAYSNSHSSHQWCHPIILSSVIPFSSCLQSFPASGSFQMSRFFASGGQNNGASASASVLPMNTQDWSPLGWTGWISLQSKGLSRVFSNTTVQKHQFFHTQLFLWVNLASILFFVYYLNLEL